MRGTLESWEKEIGLGGLFRHEWTSSFAMGSHNISKLSQRFSMKKLLGAALAAGLVAVAIAGINPVQGGCDGHAGHVGVAYAGDGCGTLVSAAPSVSYVDQVRTGYRAEVRTRTVNR